MKRVWCSSIVAQATTSRRNNFIVNIEMLIPPPVAMIPFQKQSSPKLDSITDLKSALNCFQKLLLRVRAVRTNNESDDDVCNNVNGKNAAHSSHLYATNSTIITPPTVNDSSKRIVSSSCTTNNICTMNGDDDDETRSIDFIDTEISNNESMMIMKWLLIHGPSKKLVHDMEYVIENHYHHVRDKKEEEQEGTVTDSSNNMMKEVKAKNMIDTGTSSDNSKNISDTVSKNNNASSTPILSPKLHPPIESTFITTPVRNHVIQNHNNHDTNDNTMIIKQRNGIGGRVRYNTIHDHKRTHSSRKKTKYKMTYGQRKNYNLCMFKSQTSFWEEKLMNNKMELNDGCGLEGDRKDVKGLIGSHCDGSNKQKSKSNNVMLDDDFVFHSQSSQP